MKRNKVDASGPNPRGDMMEASNCRKRDFPDRCPQCGTASANGVYPCGWSIGSVGSQCSLRDTFVSMRYRRVLAVRKMMSQHLGIPLYGVPPPLEFVSVGVMYFQDVVPTGNGARWQIDGHDIGVVEYKWWSFKGRQVPKFRMGHRSRLRLFGGRPYVMSMREERDFIRGLFLRRGWC